MTLRRPPGTGWKRPFGSSLRGRRTGRPRPELDLLAEEREGALLVEPVDLGGTGRPRESQGEARQRDTRQRPPGQVRGLTPDTARGDVFAFGHAAPKDACRPDRPRPGSDPRRGLNGRLRF